MHLIQAAEIPLQDVPSSLMELAVKFLAKKGTGALSSFLGKLIAAAFEDIPASASTKIAPPKAKVSPCQRRNIYFMKQMLDCLGTSLHLTSVTTIFEGLSLLCLGMHTSSIRKRASPPSKHDCSRVRQTTISWWSPAIIWLCYYESLCKADYQACSLQNWMLWIQ